MPPVFGPVSPSPMRLKSCAAPIGTRRFPSESAKSDTSSPSSSSSITNSPPKAVTARRASSTSSAVRHTNTPLPAARPSAFTTHGGRATDSVSAVGTPAARSTSFANVFEPSICAAAALGPKTAIPFLRRTSAMPATSGPSGPITTRSASSVSARLSRPSASSARTGWQRPIAAIPGLPGAAWSSVRPGSAGCARRARARAHRSRRPPPARGEDTCLVTVPPHSTARVDVVRVPGRRRRRMSSPSRSRSRSGSAARRSPSRCARPGHDEELAIGFALSEGLRPAGARLPDDLAANTVELDAPGFDPARLARSFYTTSSCGVCGKGALEAVAVEAPRVESDLPPAGGAPREPARPAARGAAGVRGDRRPARHRPLRRARRAALPARGRRPAQRDGQGDRLGVRWRSAAARAGGAVRQRPSVLRARAEGRGRRLSDPRRGGRSVVARGRARRRTAA